MGALERYRTFVEADVPGTHSLEAVREIPAPTRPVESAPARPVPTVQSLEIEREKTIRLLVAILAVAVVLFFGVSFVIAASQPPAPSCFALVCGDQTSGR